MKLRLGLVFSLIILLVAILLAKPQLFPSIDKSLSLNQTPNQVTPSPSPETDPLQIAQMRKSRYPGSEIKIEQVLAQHQNYNQSLASYQSEGFKIYGLLDIPTTPKPEKGYPAIIFNHGYIPPEQYRTTERYVLYQDYFAKNGYIVFKIDYRGHANSEGDPVGAYYSPAYTNDVLNALASVQKMSEANPQKIGMWGHSMGGNLALRSLVVSSEIKAVVIWGGVVGTYDQILYHWPRTATYPSSKSTLFRNKISQEFFAKHSSPSANLTFWNSIDPNANLNLIQAPIQLHAGSNDEDVPWQFSQGLSERLKSINKTVEFYTYPGGDHNISEPNFSVAIKRSLEFFDRYLK